MKNTLSESLTLLCMHQQIFKTLSIRPFHGDQTRSLQVRSLDKQNYVQSRKIAVDLI